MANLFLIDAKWKGKIELADELKKYLDKNKIKSIALFASIQFTHLKDFIKQLEDSGIKVNTTKAKRTDEKIQILGCDCYSDSFEKAIINSSDLILYIGDGLFHPKALLLSQIKSKEIKPVFIFNPISNKIKKFEKKEIEKQIEKIKRNIKLFLHSKKIGILITTKPGQQNLILAKKLSEKLESQGKKTYLFLDGSFDLMSLENYPFIDTWVNTACPRIGTDDILNIKQPIINIKEAFNPIKALEGLENRKK